MPSTEATAAIVIAGVIGVVVTPVALPSLATAAGFSTLGNVGIVGGTTAAWLMSTCGRTVAVGSICAGL